MLSRSKTQGFQHEEHDRGRPARGAVVGGPAGRRRRRPATSAPSSSAFWTRSPGTTDVSEPEHRVAGHEPRGRRRPGRARRPSRAGAARRPCRHAARSRGAGAAVPARRPRAASTGRRSLARSRRVPVTRRTARRALARQGSGRCRRPARDPAPVSRSATGWGAGCSSCRESATTIAGPATSSAAGEPEAGPLAAEQDEDRGESQSDGRRHTAEHPGRRRRATASEPPRGASRRGDADAPASSARLAAWRRQPACGHEQDQGQQQQDPPARPPARRPARRRSASRARSGSRARRPSPAGTRQPWAQPSTRWTGSSSPSSVGDPAGVVVAGGRAGSTASPAPTRDLLRAGFVWRAPRALAGRSRVAGSTGAVVCMASRPAGTARSTRSAAGARRRSSSMHAVTAAVVGSHSARSRDRRTRRCP